MGNALPPDTKSKQLGKRSFTFNFFGTHIKKNQSFFSSRVLTASVAVEHVSYLANDTSAASGVWSNYEIIKTNLCFFYIEK